MGSWWRSELMTYVSLILSEEAAPACIRELGVLGCIQFTDLNPELTPFQRRYVSYIKRCDEIERKIRYLSGEVKKLGVTVHPAGSVDAFVDASGNSESQSSAYLVELEAKLDAYEKQMVDLNKYGDKMADEYAHKVRTMAIFHFPLFLILLQLIDRLSSITYSRSPASLQERRTLCSDLTPLLAEMTTTMKWVLLYLP